LHVEVTPVAFNELSKQNHTSENSATIRQRVIKARNIQAERYKSLPGINANAQMNTKALRTFCMLNSASEALIRKAMEKLNFSARAYDRIIKVARTIADLENSVNIEAPHIAEAIQYRSLDREGWVGYLDIKFLKCCFKSYFLNDFKITFPKIKYFVEANRCYIAFNTLPAANF
jgi:magnesium chelatase family protein